MSGAIFASGIFFVKSVIFDQIYSPKQDFMKFGKSISAALTTIFAAAIFTTATAQKDFDYTFFPDAKYSQQSKTAKLDSVTQKVFWKIDSTGNTTQVQIEKSLDQFKVVNLANTSNVIYRQGVTFLGIDERQCLIYEAKTEKKEIITVNPALGFATITFRNCEGNKFAKNPDDCDKVMHTFGEILNEYKIR